ncbi:MAG: hypothetical protein ACI4DU_09060 [Lachnospiraceae bacterium]
MELYKDLVVFRTNPKELIFMYFSEALYIMDRNMELYMIEEQKKALEEAEQVIADKEQVIADKDQLIEELLQKLSKYEEQ